MKKKVLLFLSVCLISICLMGCGKFDEFEFKEITLINTGSVDEAIFNDTVVVKSADQLSILTQNLKNNNLEVAPFAFDKYENTFFNDYYLVIKAMIVCGSNRYKAVSKEIKNNKLIIKLKDEAGANVNANIIYKLLVAQISRDLICSSAQYEISS